MKMDLANFIQDNLFSSSEIIKHSISLLDNIQDSILLVTDTIKNGNKIILFGNGGSAADAQHIAAELIGRFKLERQSYPAISLSTDTSIITSLGNDYSFDVIFSRQCESLVEKNDLVIGISTSGNSKNVENGLKTSKELGAKTIGLLGNNGGKIGDIVDVAIIINSSSTDRIQEAHRTIYHIICDASEQILAKKK
jgi:D-sedoheptulose 7-phosphate isomerase